MENHKSHKEYCNSRYCFILFNFYTIFTAITSMSMTVSIFMSATTAIVVMVMVVLMVMSTAIIVVVMMLMIMFMSATAAIMIMSMSCSIVMMHHFSVFYILLQSHLFSSYYYMYCSFPLIIGISSKTF